MLLIVAAVVVVIADLALTVKTHGLYQKAVANADKASTDAKQVSMALITITKIDSH